MRHARHVAVAAAFLFASVSLASAQSPDAAGHWEGTVLMNERVPITVDLARGPAGWTGSITVPGSPAVNIPLDPVIVEAGGKVRFRAGLMEHPWFEGTVSADATTLAGDASSPRGSTSFELTRKGEPHVTPAPSSSVVPAALGGTWEGAITMDGAPRRIVLILETDANAPARASLYSVDKSTQEIPVTTVTLRAQQLELEVRAIGGSYRGAIMESGIAGQWSEGGVSLPLTFTHASADVRRPQ